MFEGQILKIGTRGSALALWQANHVQSLIAQHAPSIQTEIVVIKTSGDWNPKDGEIALNASAGGKAQFAKEIEEALLDGRIDCAVHSMKDMDSALPDGLSIPCILPRADARDALLFRNRALSQTPIAQWPAGTIVGTSSIRRQSFLRSLNPGIECVIFRGNLDTRLSKLRGALADDFGPLDATLLAMAGLTRLDMAAEADLPLPIETFIPAAAQGAIGIEICTNRFDVLWPLLASLHCALSHGAITAEREVLRVINGSCHTPIGIHAYSRDQKLHLMAQIFDPQTPSRYYHCTDAISWDGTEVDQALVLGQKIGKKILTDAPSELLKAAL